MVQAHAKRQLLRSSKSLSQPAVTDEVNKKVGELTLQTSVVFERDDVLADLNRRATAARDEKNWDKAIGLLQQAKRHEGQGYRDTRLAMYLQQGGRFEEAMREFEWLLSTVPYHCDMSSAPMTDAFRNYSIALEHTNIHNKIRIAASRENRADLVSKHLELCQQYQDTVDKLKPVIEREWKKERLAYAAKEARLKKKRQATM